MSVVASKNPFALLNDDDDDDEATSAAVAVPPSAVETLPEQPKTQKNEPRPSQTNGRGPKAPKSPDGFEVKEGRGERRGRGADRGDRGDRGGRGRGRGGRGRGGAFQDRHSHTGHVDSQKQVHQGWGGDTAEVEQAAEVEGAADAEKEVETPVVADAPAGEAEAATGETEEGEPKATDAIPAEGATATAAGEGTAPSRPPRVEEEEDKTLSYDEWLKQQKSTAPTLDGIIPKLEARKVGEDTGYEDGVLNRSGIELLKKPDQEDFFVGKNKGRSSATQPRQKKEKVVIEIEPRFAPVERGGRGRGRGGPERRGRGGPRGRGGRGGADGQPSSRPTGRGVDVDDTSAFPTLA